MGGLYYKAFLTLIILVKILFIGTSLYYRYLHARKPGDEKDIAKFELYREKADFIFTMLMAVLLIYTFNPRFGSMKNMDSETRLLFSLFGFVLIITGDWSVLSKKVNNSKEKKK